MSALSSVTKNPGLVKEMDPHVFFNDISILIRDHGLNVHSASDHCVTAVLEEVQKHPYKVYYILIA